MKKYGDAFLVIIGLLIIVGTVICYLFYNLNSATMYVICGYCFTDNGFISIY